MLETEKEESKIVNTFQKYSSRIARALSTIRAGRARAVEETFMRKLPRNNDAYLKILISCLNNPSEETVF